MSFNFSTIKKSVINVLTLVVAIGTPLLSYTTGILPENVALTISGVVAVAGSILHYMVPNTTTDPLIAQSQSVMLKPKKVTRRTRKPRKAAPTKAV